MTSNVTLDDLAPFADMVRSYTDTIDSLDAAGALDAVAQLEAFIADLNDALAMARSQALAKLEDTPIQVGNVIYAREPKFAKRANLSRVRQLIVSRALVDDNGREVKAASAVKAAERATQIAMDLFTSNSSVPKIGALQRLDADIGAIIGKELTGWQIARKALATDD